MTRRWKRLVILSLFIVVASSLFVGCSKENKEDALLDSFKEKLIGKDYKGIYALFSKNSKAYISEDDFISKYTKIYSDIEASDITIEKVKGANSSSEIPFTLKMDTVVGKVDIKDYKLKFVEEDAELKIEWDESLIFPQMQKGDLVGLKVETASRGKILDRNGTVLAEDGVLTSIGIHSSKFDAANKDEKIKELAEILDITEETIKNKLDANSNPELFVPIVDMLPTDSRLEKINGREEEGILTQSKNSRVYIDNPAFGRLIGYINPITAEELKEKKKENYKNTDLIGKAGIEQVYEDTLRSADGGELFVNRNGENVATIKKTEAQNGKDITLSIDAELQKKIYSEMGGEKGSASAVDPKTGDVLALVSSPSYNSNIYTTYITKIEKENREANNYADEENRFTKLYSPGSTFKLITAATGLKDGKINPNEKVSIEGDSWQKDSSWGSYNVTRVDEDKSLVDLNDAIKYSDNIYFAMSALNIGGEDLISGAKNFGVGEDLKIGYTMEKSKISNDNKLSKDILLADTGYGQGEVMVTPLNMALAYSALSNDGNIMKPRLIVDGKSESAIWKEEAIGKNNLQTLIDGFKGVISAGGTGEAAKIAGHTLAGKTGTAELKESQNDETGTEDGWFIATDTDTSKISISMVLEDVKAKGGSHYVVPKVKNVLEYYLNK